MNDLYSFTSAPGVRRDGTELDSPYYSDGVWMRFQRGLPRKMGGYRSMSRLLNGPVRSIMVDSRNNVNSAHYFSPWGVQRQEFSDAGAGGGLVDRTPAGFAHNDSLTWSHGLMYSSTGGTYTAIVAAATPDIDDLADDTPGNVYYGDITGTAPLVQINTSAGVPLQVSGGVCVLQPFLVAYGSNGLIRNSNANDFSAATGWVPGGGNFANTANVAGTKFLYGAPVRGGTNSPAGLFWSVDSLVRMSFNQNALTQWSYDTLSQPTSLLSKKAIIELDGRFFWPGTDRFLMYNGVVQELPNQMNLNWMFDNLNMACRNKVWGTKIPRWGELWWFYPRGSDTECGHAVIYNYRENTWYDAVRERSAGDVVQVFQYPIWAGAEDAEDTIMLPLGVELVTTVLAPAGTNVLTFASTSGALNGMKVYGDGTGVPFTTVSAITSTTLLLAAPLVADVAPATTVKISTTTSNFTVGATATGSTSGALGAVERVTEVSINLKNVTGAFLSGEVVTDTNGGAATTIGLGVSQQLVTVYQQENGKDKVVDQDVTAIPSSFTSRNFGFAVGDPFEDIPKTGDVMTMVERLEPDLDQQGPMTVTVHGRSFAQQDNSVLVSKEFAEGTNFVDLANEGCQERILSITLSSNTAGGHYQQGKIMLTLSPGDERSSGDTV